MYKALTSFTDLQDNNYRYQAGDVFPRKGLKVSKERFEELLSDTNRRGKPVIEEIKEDEKPAPAKKSTSGRKKTDAK